MEEGEGKVQQRRLNRHNEAMKARKAEKKIGKISEEEKRIALRLSPWLAAKRIYNRGSFYWLAAAPSFCCPGFPSLSSHAGTPPLPL